MVFGGGIALAQNLCTEECRDSEAKADRANLGLAAMALGAFLTPIGWYMFSRNISTTIHQDELREPRVAVAGTRNGAVTRHRSEPPQAGLVEVLREAWPRVADKTGLTESELTQEPSAVAPGASTQPSAIAPSANAPLLVETVPERHQETPNDADAPHVSASATVPANASAVAPRVHARHKQRRAKRAASRRRLQRKAAKRGDSDLVE